MKGISLEEAEKEMEEKTKYREIRRVDEIMKPAIIGLIRFGVLPVSARSKEPFPFIVLRPSQISRVATIVQAWNTSLLAGNHKKITELVLSPAKELRLEPENVTLDLRTLQEEFIAFGQWLKNLPSDYFEKQSKRR